MSHVQPFDAAEAVRVGRERVGLRVSAADSGGRLLAIDVTIPPGGGPPALHRHAPAETYRVLDGELAFYVGAGHDIRRLPAAAGAVVHLAAGEEHTVRNESGAPARAYVTFSGDVAGMEAFLRAAGGLTSADPGEVIATAAAHGIEITRPL